MLISVHIPKTAGTTFSKLLKQHFGERMAIDYGDQPINGVFYDYFHAGKVKWHITENSRKVTSQYDCIHGHFLAKKYHILAPQSDLAVWLRDPIQLSVSHHKYMKKHDEGKNKDQIVLREKHYSLSAYLNCARYQNLQSYFLTDMQIQQFKFVGLTEEFEKSIRLFNKIFDVNLDLSSKLALNYMRQDRDEDGKHIVSDEDVRAIAAANKNDIDLYKIAKLYFNQLCEIYGVN